MDHWFMVYCFTILALSQGKSLSSATKTNDGAAIKCRDPTTGKEYNPAEFFKVDECRTCLCRNNGTLTCSNPDTSCRDIAVVGQCFRRHGASLQDGDSEEQYHYNGTSSECSTCVCIGGKMECVSRKCCLYTNESGETQAAFPSKTRSTYYYDGCNTCGCPDKGPRFCTENGCLVCKYRNWDGVPGKSNIGSVHIKVRVLEGPDSDTFCYKHCSCVEQEVPVGNGLYYSKPTLTCGENCVEFM